MPLRLLPALIPSWRFFDSIGPSPRIDYALFGQGEDLAFASWQEFRPRPPRLSFAQMLLKLFWNPIWNETLFLVRLAERIMEGETDFPAREIHRRLTLALTPRESSAQGADNAPLLAFRIRALSRDGEGRVHEDVVFLAAAQALEGNAIP